MAGVQEAEAKAKLLRHIRRKKILKRTSVLINEFSIADARADVVVAANGRLHCYEIKSKADSLRRLKAQTEVFCKFFDTVTLVLDEKHVKAAFTLVPRRVGIWVLQDDKVYVLRESKLVSPTKLTLCASLSLVELRRVASSNDLSGDGDRAALAQALTRLPYRTLKKAVIEYVRKKFSPHCKAFIAETAESEIQTEHLQLLSPYRSRRERHAKTKSEIETSWSAWAAQVQSTQSSSTDLIAPSGSP
ncbi:sce7726 family protein [Pseudorhodoplanes sp.]|uniref:sce7726 family protein n=1 Tax=Pseudorhodoplanes sp. TaxID=1934341 RepID=UPI003D1071A3